MINNVTLMGRLTADPELKATTSGVTVMTFCIAVDRRYQQNNGERQTDFINCVAWRSTAEFISRYFRKGDTIGIIGEIQMRKYQDKSGNNRTAFEVIANEATFCGSKNNSNNAEAPTAPTTPTESNTDNNFDDDDLPF